MADDHANNNRVNNINPIVDEDPELQAAIDAVEQPDVNHLPYQPDPEAAAIVEDSQLDPAGARVAISQIAVAMDEAAADDVPVTFEVTKKRALEIILELLPQFDPKEVKSIVKADKIRRKVAKIQAKHDGTIGSILSGR